MIRRLCHLSAMKKLSAAQIKSALATVPEWRKKSSTITRTFQFKNFPAAVRFVNAVAKISERIP